MEELAEALQRLQSAVSALTAAMPMHPHRRGGRDNEREVGVPVDVGDPHAHASATTALPTSSAVAAI